VIIWKCLSLKWLFYWVRINSGAKMVEIRQIHVHFYSLGGGGGSTRIETSFFYRRNIFFKQEECSNPNLKKCNTCYRRKMPHVSHTRSVMHPDLAPKAVLHPVIVLGR
jgi:hypothetical protein